MLLWRASLPASIPWIAGSAGPIPESVGTIERLVRFKMQGNKLTGPIPANFGDLKALEWIRVFGEMLVHTE